MRRGRGKRRQARSGRDGRDWRHRPGEAAWAALADLARVAGVFRRAGPPGARCGLWLMLKQGEHAIYIGDHHQNFHQHCNQQTSKQKKEPLNLTT